MSLLKIIVLLFAVYFFRRMYQLYRFIQKVKIQGHTFTQQNTQKANAINAEYRVVSRE
ncbi:MAG: hypothetical protein JNM93_06415 [Bacteriovoracaceae bacterium]|nr:hypothetical protein [Bacteriovoracaceae bacterium]